MDTVMAEFFCQQKLRDYFASFIYSKMMRFIHSNLPHKERMTTLRLILYETWVKDNIKDKLGLSCAKLSSI